MADNQRQELIQTAMAKMRQVGIRSVSIDDVCRELGISKKTFYVYFATKDELVEAMLYQLENDVNANIRNILKEKTVMELLLNCQKIIHNARDVRKIPPLLFDLEKYYPQLYKAHNARTRQYAKENMHIVLSRGIEEHIFREDLDIDKVSSIIVMMRETVMNMPLERREDRKTMEIVKYSIDIVMRGIMSEEGRRKMVEMSEKK